MNKLIKAHRPFILFPIRGQEIGRLLSGCFLIPKRYSSTIILIKAHRERVLNQCCFRKKTGNWNFSKSQTNGAIRRNPIQVTAALLHATTLLQEKGRNINLEITRKPFNETAKGYYLIIWIYAPYYSWCPCRILQCIIAAWYEM